MFSALSGSINILIFIAGLLLSLMIVYLYIKFYEPYFFPNLAYSKDVNKIIKTNDTIKQNLLLIKGIMNVKETDEISFTGASYNKNNNNYIPFLSSINMDGGNQYTISFWMKYVKNENQDNDFILLSKHNNCKKKDCNYSPQIKVTSNGYFEVKYVDNQGRKTRHFGEDNESNGILDKRNHNSWYLYTFVFKDYRDVLHQNIVGHQVMLYINDILYKRHTIEGKVIKVHHNDLKILPDNNESDNEKAHYDTNKTKNESKVADVRYINYALSHNDIVKMYRKGFNNEVFKTYFQLNKGFSRQNINVIRLQGQLSD